MGKVLEFEKKNSGLEKYLNFVKHNKPEKVLDQPVMFFGVDLGKRHAVAAASVQMKEATLEYRCGLGM